ncbi:MAG TPA: ABC transporter ATP-binding protein [bacterium]
MPDAAPPAADERRRVYRRLLGYLRPYRGRMALAFFSMMLFGALDGAIPLLLKHIFDDIFGDHNRRMLWVLTGLIVGLALLRAPFGFLQRYLSASVGLRVVRDLRNDVHRHLLTLSESWFARRASGDVLSGVASDTVFVRNALVEASVTVVRGVFRVISLVAVAFWLDPLLATFSLVGLPLSLYPLWRFGRKVRSYSRKGQSQTGDLTSLLQESILGHRVVQAFGREEYERRRFEAENARMTRTWEKAEKYAALAFPTTEVAASAAIALVVVYGGLSVISGARQQGEFLAFITGMFLLYDPLKNLGRVHSTIQMGVAAGERLFELLDAPPEIVDRPGAVHFGDRDPAARTRVEYRNVTFHYPGEAGAREADLEDGEGAPPALDDVSLTIEPGRTLALVGMSGGGKTTLAHLLPRFYDPTAGAVLVGGVDLRDYHVGSLRAAIALVGQHAFLFNDTVRANIRYGRLEATDAEVEAAARSACAHDFIAGMPQGYDTAIGEQGLRLSGGERARIAIARALLKNAPILILDEATAALDSASERLVQTAIERLMAGRTTLVIAHRLSTIRNADEIAVIEHGRVVERGTHDELIARGGAYERLHRLQFRG